jgi:translocation and assembly module TamB
MSEPEFTPLVPSDTSEILEPSAPRPNRLRRFYLRHLPLSVAGLVVLLAITLTGLYFWASSAGFENMVRRYLVNKVETATGGRVEIASFHWRLLHLEAEADGVVIHGIEDPGEAPYAQLGHLRVRLSVLGFLSPHIEFRELEIYRPHIHLIVYPNGSTNQPQPRRPQKQGKPALDNFFDLRAGRVEVEQGVFEYDDRNGSFDYQARFIPLDFAASDLSLLMTYAPPAVGKMESYRIDAGVRDFSLARGATHQPGKLPPPQVHGTIQASLELTRNRATLNSMSIIASGRGVKDRTLEISGVIDDFANPRWQAKAVGDLDMRLVDAIFGYPCTPQGLAHLNLAGAGEAGHFRMDGSLHIEDGSYIGTGVVARGITLDAQLHGDQDRLLISSIAARLREGGQLTGEIDLHPWLPFLPGTTTVQPVLFAARRSAGPITRDTTVRTLPFVIPVNGKVTAQFKNVALDTVMEMVADPPFQHLGFDSRINGPATALWTNGVYDTVSVSTHFVLTPPAEVAQGKTPASGVIDATYTQRDGAVDLRKLELDLPSSQLTARGHLGAYPAATSSALTVDFHSANLGEFDTTLRDLGLSRNGRSGTAALPIALSGQGDFHGTWTGSLLDPHLSGKVKATQIAVELPANVAATSSQPQYISVDSVEAAGSYSADRIEITHGILRRGNGTIVLNGTLAAGLPPVSPGQAHHPPTTLSFDANSILHLHLASSQIALDNLRPIIGQKLPVTGALDAQLQLDGALRALDGSGWVELNKGSVFGEAVAHVRAQGSIADQSIKLTSLTASDEAGKISATGEYDLSSRRFQLDAKGAGIDMARIEALRRNGLAVTGKLGLSVQGSGTLDDPRLEVHAAMTSLNFGGEPLGGLELTAHTANHDITYDLTTRLESAEFAAHGQTALSGDFTTQVQLDFSRFNIGFLLRMAHIRGLNGESALAGKVTLEGPLARPDQLRGEATLDQLAVTVSGVHLQSEGGLHATLDHALVHLDPLHITGEQTDLHLQGSLSLKDRQQLDASASGTINLKVAETLDPDLTASGMTTFKVEAHGPLADPGFSGRIDFQDAALSLEDLPNGLSQLHGTLEFTQNRLEVKTLTAMTGGGLLNVGGYLAYQQGLYANLTVTGSGVRIRYPQGVSSLADASLRLQGQQNNLLLSGDVLLTRFSVSPDLDMVALMAQANAVESVASPDAPSNHIRLDVHITSSQQLSFQNAYAKLAGNVDLRLRGTVASPSLLGRVSITEGSGIIAGTRYDLQRGDIFFTNPVRIQPSIDLSATARVEDYDITLGLHGTLDKPTVSYHSDPPLPEADVVALLALGRTGSQQRLYTQQQEAGGANPTTDALLGGALNATVSSRVQRLFGAGSVKVDPNYVGAMGISTSRVIVEEQFGRNLTLTYATNFSTTSQQLIQAEIAINRHVSLQLARDESGVFSVVVKATRRFR